MRIAIVIDAWKLAKFSKRLKKAGFTWGQHPGVAKDTLTLAVETEEPEKLYKVVKAVNDECAKS